MEQRKPITFALATDSANESNIGGILLDMGKISPDDAEHILRLQKEKGIRFGEAAQSLGLITEEDIQQVLARQFSYPYLLPGQSDLDPQLVAAFDPFSRQVEALRAVRSQLMLRWFATDRKALALASVNSAEGTSLFAANLAVVFSQLGEKTLLVDANLRKPRQHKIFNLSNRQGLSDILALRADLGAISELNYFRNLSVLQAGTIPPNPHELLSKKSSLDFMTAVASLYDVVLYDVPAFSSASDALEVAARAGGVAIIARRNVTALKDISVVSDDLKRSGAAVTGVVVVDF